MSDIERAFLGLMIVLSRKLRKRETTKTWRAVNSKRYAASKTAWNTANKEHISAQSRAYKKKNAKQVAAYLRKWRKDNSEWVKSSHQAWRDVNREKVREGNREFYKKNPELWAVAWHRRRSRLQGNGGEFSVQEWAALKNKYNNQCLCCGRNETLLVFLGLTLSPDHILPLVKGGRNDIDNIQPLCNGKGGCNNRKLAKYIDYRPVLEVA